MIIAGKCPPEKEELDAARSRGFESVELYLEKRHLDEFELSLENCLNSDLEVVSLHTPHVGIEEEEYLLKADKLARELDAKLVFHSKKILHTAIPEVEHLDLVSVPAFENQPGSSVRHLRHAILDQGYQLVLDTAHLYMSEKNYIGEIEDLLQNHCDRIPVIHLCDSTTTKDGLGFEEGTMEMRKLSEKIDYSDFDGLIVLEVMPEKQEDALEKWRKYIS